MRCVPKTDQSAPVNRGDLVDLIGFPAIGAFTPTLVNANYRRADADQRSVRGPSADRLERRAGVARQL